MNSLVSWVRRSGLILAPLLLAGGAARAGTLLHQYDFNGSVTDSAGSMNGTLFNGATASGGALSLNGSSQYAQLSGFAIPTQNFSITFDATILGYTVGGYNEMISQGSSGAPGFYIGLANDFFRLGDAVGSTAVQAPTDGKQHAYELISSATGTQFYIDTALVFSSATAATAPQSGTNTQFGAQFGGFGEYFDGSIASVAIYSGLPATVPEPAGWALLGVAGLALARLRRRAPTA